MTDDLEELPGVGPATADKLLDSGFDDYKSLAVADAANLSEETDVGESTAKDIVKAAREEADIGGFETGNESMQKRAEMDYISTQIDGVDELLGGRGIETKSITELYGEFGSGKSQVTHQMAVNVQLPQEVGGAHGRAIFLDTEKSFRPERIAQMVRGLDEDVMEVVLDHEDMDYTVDEIKDSEITRNTANPRDTPIDQLAQRFLNRVEKADIHNSNHQILMAEEAINKANEFADSEYPVKMLIVDSLTSHFRSEYVGRGQLADRQQKLNKHLHDILQFAELNNAAAVVANQVQSNPNSYFGDPTKPIGGNILGHTSTYRVYLRQAKGDKRMFKLVNSPNLPEGEFPIEILGDGIKSGD
jgi:DNA repair protein RadA